MGNTKDDESPVKKEKVEVIEKNNEETEKPNEEIEKILKGCISVLDQSRDQIQRNATTGIDLADKSNVLYSYLRHVERIGDLHPKISGTMYVQLRDVFNLYHNDVMEFMKKETK